MILYVLVYMLVSSSLLNRCFVVLVRGGASSELMEMTAYVWSFVNWVFRVLLNVLKGSKTVFGCLGRACCVSHIGGACGAGAYDQAQEWQQLRMSSVFFVHRLCVGRVAMLCV
jgi:hypothetical protein